MRLLVAKFVAPMTEAGDRDVIENGGVMVDKGGIVAVDSATTLRHQHGGAIEDLGEVLLTPGLVNAHTHLELSDRPRGERPASFGEWIGRLAGRRDEWKPESAAEAGIAELLRFGVTCIGDISQFASVTRSLLAASSLRGVSYAEVLGLGKSQSQADEKLQAAIVADKQAGDIAFGITPHAPYTVNAGTLRQVAARRGSRPLAMHLAESPEEAQFVRETTGPLREIWERFDAWTSDAFEPFDGSPVAWAAAAGLLETAPLLAHVNYLQRGDLDLLAKRSASVAYCPRTHAWFGHETHPMETLLHAGVNVCLATDSRATSPDLNVM
ncbi:MAG: amidohydrolase family protein, partial [Planctomycetota bacterium]